MQSTNQRIFCDNSKGKPFYMIAASMGETLYRLWIASSVSRHGGMLNDIDRGTGMRLVSKKTLSVYRGGIFMFSHKGTCQVVQTLAPVFASTPYPIRPTYSSIHILARLLS
jgi:hypothetical protein